MVDVLREDDLIVFSYLTLAWVDFSVDSGSVLLRSVAIVLSLLMVLEVKESYPLTNPCIMSLLGSVSRMLAIYSSFYLDE